MGVAVRRTDRKESQGGTHARMESLSGYRAQEVEEGKFTPRFGGKRGAIGRNGKI